ncbi:periphilin-1-like isoform X2 [Notolabrus celidotus]|uniref:periphilin-1-like isoform X2 n=1 Tax=Notolabrus celidotus TaxID=1203425 RepID=UPI0014904C44|nr:periphilin-1-like isoform X2 [Notolabrus celidotus]
MAFRHGRQSIREAYEQRFTGTDSREVTVHRVVNIVEKRNPMPRPGLDYQRGFDEDQWYDNLNSYPDDREYHEEYGYPPNDRRYYDDNPSSGNFRRNSSPPRNDGPYSQQSYAREDLRHQLGSRSNGRARPYFRSKGRGSGPPQREDPGSYRNSLPVSMKRDRSPRRREAMQPPVRSGSNSSRKSFSPERDKNYTQRHKPSTPASSSSSSMQTSSSTPSSNTPSRNISSSITASSSEEESSHSLGSSEEKTPASVAETEKAVTASMEPELTLDEDLKARRLEAIKAKALEIEKHYRQDCETFRTVVKMLVDKEPSLGNLLQAPLDKNLLEIKHRCLDSLKDFMKELDEVLEHPDTSPEDTGLKTLT